MGASIDPLPGMRPINVIISIYPRASGQDILRTTKTAKAVKLAIRLETGPAIEINI